MFEDCNYIRNLLDMIINVEIQQRQDVVFREEGVVYWIQVHAVDSIVEGLWHVRDDNHNACQISF